MSGFTGNADPFVTTPSGHMTDPRLSTLFDEGRAEKAFENASLSDGLCRAVDSLPEFLNAGIVMQVDAGGSRSRVRRVRLPLLPNDVNVVVLLGPADPAPNSAATNHALRNELIAGGLACGAAIFGWIGFVGGAFLAVPTGGLSVVGMVYDGMAAGAASIACINSGVRVLNEARGNHAKNEALDKNPAYARTMIGTDAFGAAGIVRGAADGVRAALSVAGVASTAIQGGSIAGAVRLITLDREIRVRMMNALGAVLSAVGSNDAGALGELERGLGIPFTIVLTN